MKTLVLAEKPSVAREIARVLGCNGKQKSYIEGPKYVVTWALGHLVGLAEPEDYDKAHKEWSLEPLPLLPEKMKLKVLRQTSGQYKAVQFLMKRPDIKHLIIATDAAREGELLARWIMIMAGWKGDFQRLWISSQTDKAIKEGFANLKPGRQFDRLYQSARCRAEADWMIGLNVTRALTCKFGTPLSAGRVQTPTLGMMMEREKEIRNFRSQEYCLVQGDFGSFSAIWRNNQGEARLFEPEKARAIQSKLEGQSGKITMLKKSEKSVPHPQAYDLTELQRDANRLLGFSAKQTSNVLQRLYEQYKLVTYPRTDSKYLSSDMVSTLKERLQRVAVGSYAAMVKPLMQKPLAVTKRFVDDSKVSDHHAIIPTEQQVNISALTFDERRLYDLIVRRFISLFYPPARYDQVSVAVTVAGEVLHAKGKTVKEQGWRTVYDGKAVDEDAKEQGDHDTDNAHGDNARLPELREGQAVQLTKVRVQLGRTMPPKRYNEAGLLTQMEKYGLGTPATRADIIEKLVSSDTIERQGSSLMPTGKGHQLIELAPPELREAELTAQWESELERIAKGQGKPEQFLQEIREMSVKLVSGVKTSAATYKAQPQTPTDDRRGGGRGKREPRISKKETQTLMKKFGGKQEEIGTSLGDLLKAAMEKKQE